MVDPWDIAAVAAAALTGSGHEGQAYALTGPQALNFGEMAEVFSKLLRKSIRYVNISDQAAAEGMRKAGLPEYVIEGLIGTFAAVLPVSSLKSRMTSSGLPGTCHAPSKRGAGTTWRHSYSKRMS